MFMTGLALLCWVVLLIAGIFGLVICVMAIEIPR
jgi:hypothetical protein